MTTAAPPAPSSESAASAAASSASASARVKVAANAPITGLSVDGRWVPINPPAREVDLELSPAEASRKATVQAVSSDQRRATTVIPRGAKRAVVTFKDSAAKGGKLMRGE